MPHRTFTTEEVARYLHLTPADVERLLKDGAIPHEVRGHRPVFRKSDIDAWASQRILGMQDRPLAEYHRQSSRGTKSVLSHEAMMPYCGEVEVCIMNASLKRVMSRRRV